MTIPYYPTGVPVLDTGDCPGLPAGKIVHLIGDADTGKTTVAIMAASELAKAGWVTYHIDWMNGLTSDYLKFHGVDRNKYTRYKPSSQKQGLDVALLALNGGTQLIVLDGACGNINDLTPKEERVETMALWAQDFPLLKAAAEETNTAILVLSRGNRKATPCGTTLKFYANRRILLEKGDAHPHIRYSVLEDRYGRSDPYGRGKYTLPVPVMP